MSPLQQQVALAQFTTLKVGGSAEFFIEVHNESELHEAVTLASKKEIPVTVLGGGSNVLISDSGIKGLVIKLGNKGIIFSDVQDTQVTVRVAAGEFWDTFVLATTQKNLWGVENLSGIPGSVGSAPIQNINAYGVSVGDRIKEIETYHIPTGEQMVLTHEACAFGYRDSFFKTPEGKDHIITHVTFSLSTVNNIQTTYRSSSQSIASRLQSEGVTEPTVHDVRRIVLLTRKNIGMLEGLYQSAGSFFKNITLSRHDFKKLEAIVTSQYKEKSEELAPWYWVQKDGSIKVSTAFLMECTPYNKSDFKEKLFNGTVGISPLHTLSLINSGDAKASDIEAFALLIAKTIKEKFNVTIEPEVCYLK